MAGNTTATRVPVELLRKYDRPGPRYTSYPTVPVWSNAIGADDYRESLRRAGADASIPIAVYCHIPFCRSRCFYCGCNTCIVNRDETVRKYISVLQSEMSAAAAELGERRRISQFHFGGGTPTYLSIEQLAAVLDHFEGRFEIDASAERSIEVDPRVTGEEHLEFLASRGFNRLSVGVQDFDPEVQDAIGRRQPEAMVADILKRGRELGFSGINFDLIYGLPRQTVASFTTTLETTLALRPDRLAVYSFAYLPNVKAHQMKIDPDELPKTEDKYRLFALAVERLTAAGYRQIGMDHFALPDDELSRAQDDGRLHRNFMGYTVQTSPDMLGLGMSSIGYIDHAFFQSHSKLTSYQNAIDEHGYATFRGMRLSDDDLVRQYVITSLMCNFRLDYKDLTGRLGADYGEYFGEEHSELAPFIEDGFLEATDTGLEILPLGRTFVRNICMTFDAYLRRKTDDNRPTFSRTI